MKTAIQEFLDYMKEYNMILVKEGIEPNLVISMLQHKAEKLLEKEKEQIIDFSIGAYQDISRMKGVSENLISENKILFEDYYNQTFNQNKS